MPRHSTRLLRLRDGRTVEYALYGDPAGKPVIFFHGFFGCCHQAALGHDLARKAGLCLIAPNRPGIGASTPHRLETMTQYVSDIEELADAMGVKMFAVVGASGGGCFALACASTLPERVRLAWVFGCMGPMSKLWNLRQMSMKRRLFLTVCAQYPRLARLLLYACFALCKRYPSAVHNLFVRMSSVADGGLFSSEQMRRVLRYDFDSIFLQQQGIDALLLESTLYFHWGFDPRDIRSSIQVLFWHGDRDSIIPWATAQRTVDSIRHARLMLCPGGHLSFILKKADEIFRRMKHECAVLAPV